jgi:hypothetical protein
MVLIPENAEYILGGIPDSVLLLAFAVAYGIVWYKVFIKKAEK